MSKTMLIGLLVVTASLPVPARERITLKVSPAVAFAPANLIVRTMIEADAENRAVEIVAESNDFYRSSEIQLDGEHAPRTTTFEFRGLPSGEYDVKATLLGSDGSALATVRRHMNVISSSGH